MGQFSHMYISERSKSECIHVCSYQIKMIGFFLMFQKSNISSINFPRWNYSILISYSCSNQCQYLAIGVNDRKIEQHVFPNRTLIEDYPSQRGMHGPK